MTTKTLELTEINAILAGLRMLQSYWLINGYKGINVYDILTDNGHDPVPTTESIDALCERINCSTVYLENENEADLFGMEEEDDAREAIIEEGYERYSR